MLAHVVGVSVQQTAILAALAGLTATCGGAVVSDAGPRDLAATSGADLAGGGDTPLDQSTLADLLPDLALGPYPAGPYGNQVGDVIPPLVWEGYVDLAADAVANTKPYRRYTMDDLRRSGARYGMVHVAEFT